MEGGEWMERSTLAAAPLTWEAVVLGVAFVAVVLGAVGLAVALYHFYVRAGKGAGPSARAAQLYESVTIRPVVGEGVEGVEGVVEVMPREAGDMTSAMSYDVTPDCSHL